MTDLAIYDMDRTVTRRATYTPFLLHCAARRAPWRLLALPLVIGSMLLYLAKAIDRGRLKEINHRLLLGARIHPDQLLPLVDSFANRTVHGNVRPGAVAAIARDKREGRRVVMATASYRFYAQAVADRLGFDDCIGTNSILGLDSLVHARIDGENCYGPAKLRMIHAWLAASGIKPGHVRFYSDHASDAPVFEWADEAVAVNPHDRLARLAATRGWRVEDWNRRSPAL
jgi:HAD superfamily hydrolase (TIGR01490 family)